MEIGSPEGSPWNSSVTKHVTRFEPPMDSYKGIATTDSRDNDCVSAQGGGTEQSLFVYLTRFLPAVSELISLTVHDKLFDRFKIPAAFRSAGAQNANGYFGCQDTRDANGVLDSFCKS